ncbi:hypothetical protein IscW_ISCW018816, partial [Ixodes scapularis]
LIEPRGASSASTDPSHSLPANPSRVSERAKRRARAAALLRTNHKAPRPAPCPAGMHPSPCLPKPLRIRTQYARKRRANLEKSSSSTRLQYPLSPVSSSS